MKTRSQFPLLAGAIAASLLLVAITSVAAFGSLGRGSAPRVPQIETALALESDAVAAADTLLPTPEPTPSVAASAAGEPPARVATPPGTTRTEPAPSTPSTSNSDDDEDEEEDREVITPEIRDDDHSEDKESRPAEDEADTRDTEEH